MARSAESFAPGEDRLTKRSMSFTRSWLVIRSPNNRRNARSHHGPIICRPAIKNDSRTVWRCNDSCVDEPNEPTDCDNKAASKRTTFHRARNVALVLFGLFSPWNALRFVIRQEQVQSDPSNREGNQEAKQSV